MNLNKLEKVTINGREAVRFPKLSSLVSYLIDLETKKRRGKFPCSIDAYIIIKSKSFSTPRSEDARTYIFSSNNKLFMSIRGGYSVFASNIDGSDRNIRISEHIGYDWGKLKDWKVQECGIFR